MARRSGLEPTSPLIIPRAPSLVALPPRICCTMGWHGQSVTDEPSLSSRPSHRTVTLSDSVLLHCSNLPLDSALKGLPVGYLLTAPPLTAAMFRLHLG